MSYFEGGSDSDNNSVNDSGSDSESDNDSVIPTIKKDKKIPLTGENIILDDDEEDEDEDEESIPDDEGEEDDVDVAKGPEYDEEDDLEEEEDIDENVEEEEETNKPAERKKKIIISSSNVGKKGKIPSVADLQLSDDDDDDDDEEGEQYLKKFDKEINDNYLLNFHPECALHNYDEVLSMTKVIRDKNGIIIDDLHKTLPYLTKYERARVLGQRAKQINSGSTTFVKVPENVIDGYLIAELELKEKRIPFIIRRPLPNGGSEYWSIKDLENIIF